MKVVLIYLVSWLGMMVIAILNGIVREGTYGCYKTELSAHQLSTLIDILLLGIFVWALTGIYPIKSSTQAICIGSMWVIMTVVFEFSFGHWVIGHPWNKLFKDYNLLKGRIWLLLLVWIALSPYVFYWIQS